jgi:hypothetical protein
VDSTRTHPRQTHGTSHNIVGKRTQSPTKGRVRLAVAGFKRKSFHLDVFDVVLWKFLFTKLILEAGNHSYIEFC